MTSKMSFKRPDTMLDLFNDDPFGLLSDVGEKKAKMTFSEKIESAFEEIASFIKQNKRLPIEDSDDFDEEMLARSYQKLIQLNPEGRDYCESLLPEELRSARAERVRRTTLTREEVIRKQVQDMQSKRFDSIDDILDNDPFGLLSDDECSDLAEHEDWRDTEEYKTKRLVIEEPVARANKCDEFYRFEPYFDKVKRLLADGHIRQVKIVGGESIDIVPGQFFIIDGMLSLIASASLDDKKTTKASNDGHIRQVKIVGGESIDIVPGQFFIIDGMLSLIASASLDDKKTTKASKKIKYRVRQIFDNGTESFPFSTSVKASFYKSDPPCVRLVADDDQGRDFLQELINEIDPLFDELNNSGKPNGYVYILGSLSQDPTIRELSQRGSLVKIGYTDRTVEERIVDAEKSSTYLFAPVKVLAKIACFNFDANKLEEALHTIFAIHRLNVTLKDGNGGYYRPEEWFTVSADTACEVVDHIMANDLHKYYIDPIQGRLKLKQK